MKIRPQIAYAPEGLGFQQDTSTSVANPATSEQKTTEAKTNAGDDGNLFADLWSKPETKETKTETSTAPTQTQTAPQTVDQDTAIENFYKSIGLPSLELSDEDREEMGPKAAGLIENMNAGMRTAVLNLAKMMQTQSKKVGEEATQAAASTATDTLALQAFREKMRQDLPFTAQPEIAPIAETVAKKFLERGMSQPDALKNTDKFFAHISNLYRKHAQPDSFDGPFGGRGSDIDFLELLSGS
jgi:hypothetical protein